MVAGQLYALPLLQTTQHSSGGVAGKGAGGTAPLPVRAAAMHVDCSGRGLCSCLSGECSRGLVGFEQGARGKTQEAHSLFVSPDASSMK